MERPMTAWERALVERLGSVQGDGQELVTDSIPHLVVTGMCGCGCPSFNVRDNRFPPQPHELGHFANGWSAERTFGFMLWVGPDGRPISVDVEVPPEWSANDSLPDPAEVEVASPYV